jgi:hypothetical protein
MPKRPGKKVSTKPTRSTRRMPRWVPHVIGAVILLSALIVTVFYTERFVDQHIAAPTGPLNVVIANQPRWMSDYLASQIQATVPRVSSSAFDRDLLATAASTLAQNPWVNSVRQVRRAYGQRPGDTLLIDCDFRAPIALVHWGDYYWLVDGEGTKLPEQFTSNHVPRIVLGRDGHMNIRVIDGVRQPPPDTGHRWIGGDLAAGLSMAKLLYGKPAAEQIVIINVTNYAGRIDPREAQIVLQTKFATEVRWGRPPEADDALAEVPPTQKLDEMSAIMRQYKRVDAGHPWVDLRFDKVTYPTPAPGQDPNAPAPSAAAADAASADEPH